MPKYNHQKIEKKWWKKWEKGKLYEAKDFSPKPKFYGLVEFPYPSGDGLHTGHVRSYTAMDIVARKRRMDGFNVLYPIGWDAFGLPTENYAIKHHIHPKIVTKKNTDTFRRQLQSIGFSFDWKREINTTDPEYYRWTQWIFLELYKHGLAYKKKMPINWCLSCKTGLANEEVVDGRCERCGSGTEKREKEQWVLAITKYADKLLEGLKEVDYLEKIKIQQANWIGRSSGAAIKFGIIEHTNTTRIKANNNANKNANNYIEVFTTRPDTLFGCTYMVVAPEHSIIENLKFKIKNFDEVSKYIDETKKKSDLERTDLAKAKTGVELKGIKAKNPANGEEIPIWVADYVLASYGTGAIMAVPAHDERDWEFAKKYNLPIKYVVEPKFVGTKGDGAVKPDLEFVKRNAVCAVVRNPKDNSYLCVSWKNFKMNGLVTGGIEGNENVIDTARREILEETGYKNLNFVRTSEMAINTFFYHRVKQQNRWAHFQFVFFDLKDEEREPIADHEANLHEIVWKKESELSDFFTVFEGEFLVRLLKSGDFAFTDDGIMANSGQFDGLDSEKAKKEITKFVGGETKVNYHLRDWIFSRQHYWGEPIPLVFCENCKKEAESLKDDSRVVGVGALIETADNVFIFQRRDKETNRYPDMAAPFGGGLSKGEDFISALKREIKEELSISLNDAEIKEISNFKSHFEQGKLIKMFYVKIGDLQKIDLREGKRIVKTDLGKALSDKKTTDFTKEVIKYFQDSFNEGAILNPGWVPVPEKDLPVELPNVKNYEPTDTGESPLAAITKWVNTKCPKCGGPAKRETDTMPNWAGSSWYFLRYTDPKNKKALADMKKLKYWAPVDWYNGGMEHTTLHLLYSRFWNKFFFDIGAIPNSEPYQKRTSQGMVLGAGGEKMSKSKGNVVNPDKVVEEFGADTLRLYEMFMGPFDQAIPWDEKGLTGCYRFLTRVWELDTRISRELDANKHANTNANKKLERLLHKTIKKVGEDIESMAMNTAVSALMIISNEFNKAEAIPRDIWEKFLAILAPFAPFITEELWSGLGKKKSIHLEPWPKFNPALMKDEEVEVVIQINGKVREKIKVSPEISEEEIKKLVLASEKIKQWLEGKEPKKIIYVKGRLVSIVV